ncbi:hypothetical protein [Vallitalea sp.]|jgi:hypothetical protein|uniref:hypothetical protein n=1 Tax=Vallitalea sp. TaxID=1882829 RepID=UPI0025F129E3|nr:hypothetical protein [Vallitalea sp.]MCT4686374.1 hypothetical protein [Vallitalea sp.]
MDNIVCQGYLLRALNKLIKANEIKEEVANKVKNAMYFEFDMMTEKEAENYYYNHYLGDE